MVINNDSTVAIDAPSPAHRGIRVKFRSTLTIVPINIVNVPCESKPSLSKKAPRTIP